MTHYSWVPNLFERKSHSFCWQWNEPASRCTSWNKHFTAFKFQVAGKKWLSSRFQKNFHTFFVLSYQRLQNHELAKVEYVWKYLTTKLFLHERRKVHPNWETLLISSGYPLLKRLNNYAAVKFATRVREVRKGENEPLKCYKWASAAQKRKVGHPGIIC